MTSQDHILVVDDDPEVRESVGEYLAHHGFSISTAEDGVSMRAQVEERRPDLVILDLGLPGEGGLALAGWLRARGGIGIVMLTGLAEPIDRVVGLEVGADDYLGKPYLPRELLARVRAVLRRGMPVQATPADSAPNGPPMDAKSRVRFGTKWLNVLSHVLQDDAGLIFPLTASEFNLLKAFADNPRRVLSRERLLDLAEARDSDVFDRAIDVRITRLRKKIEATPDKPEFIQTVRGIGYLFSPDGRML